MAEPITLEAKKCAVILVDMLNAVVKGEGPPFKTPPDREEIVGAFQKLVAHCRSVGTPLVYITTERRPDGVGAPTTITDIPVGAGGSGLLAGSPGVQIIDELRPQPEDFILVKPRFSAFYGTSLDVILKALGTETILVGGISTQRSVEGTVRDAKNRDLQCVVVSDCCTARPLDQHEMTLKHIMPDLARVRTTDEVIAALRP